MKNTQLEDILHNITINMIGDVDPNYDPSTEIPTKAFFYRNEIPIADYLMNLKEGLTKDYMNGYTTLKDAIEAQGKNVLKNNEDTRYGGNESELIRKVVGDESIASSDNWKSTSLIYKFEAENYEWHIDPEEGWNRYPTAYKLIKELGDDCPIANYSAMAPQTVLHRHTGPENRTGEYIRIHIPLIIPNGDVFFEVNGEEITWDDLFGFDNQLVHSAHNYTDEYRLIFLIDIRRSAIGLPPGQPWNKNRQLTAKPFVRKK
jgi:hypothetical protein